jgi:hypothetical protein
MTSLLTAGTLSSSVSSQLITNEIIIREAYERIGIVSDNLSNQQLVSALNSCNLILNSWLNKGLRAWMIRQKMEAVVLNQQQYFLLDENGNNTISDIRDCVLRTQARLATYDSSDSTLSTGTPIASSSTANNAFDSTSDTPVTIAGSDATIGFNFNLPVSTYSNVTLIGINSNVERNYTFDVQTSSDGDTWSTITSIPSYTYPANNIIWQPIFSGPTLQYLQLKETSSKTLKINQLYFSNIVNDIYMTRIARDVYTSLPSKQSSNSSPNQYFFDRQINPAFYPWPYPTTITGSTTSSSSTTYNNQWIFLLNYTKALYDIGGLFNVPEIPSRFFEAMIAELTLRLAIKAQKTDMISIYASDAENSFRLAMIEDTERTPIQISSYGGYGGGIY